MDSHKLDVLKSNTYLTFVGVSVILIGTFLMPPSANAQATNANRAQVARPAATNSTARNCVIRDGRRVCFAANAQAARVTPGTRAATAVPQKIKKPSHLFHFDIGTSNLNNDASKVALEAKQSSMTFLGYEYRFQNELGLHVVYANVGDFVKSSKTADKISIAGSLLGVSLRKRIKGSTSLTGEAGVSMLNTTNTSTNTTTNIKTSISESLARGYSRIGIDYDINRNFSVSFKYHFYSKDLSGLSLGFYYGL